MVSLFSVNLEAQERKKIDDLQILYLIKVKAEKTGNKDYRIFINDSDWFKRWSSGKDQVIIEVNQKDGFIKPSYVKKVKRQVKQDSRSRL
tara:strand:+ start:279 stop:548 length:270 start_codon:yes stop_codon:yes gene_type:complete